MIAMFLTAITLAKDGSMVFKVWEDAELEKWVLNLRMEQNSYLRSSLQ
jgi:hypothetical protein